MENTLKLDIDEIEEVEDFFSYFKVPYDAEKLNSARIAILRRFSMYRTQAEADIVKFGYSSLPYDIYRDALIRSYYESIDNAEFVPIPGTAPSPCAGCTSGC